MSLPEGFDAAAVLSAAGVDRKWVPHAEFMVGDVCHWRHFYRCEPDEYQPYSVHNFRAGVPQRDVAMLTRALTPVVLESRDGGKYRFDGNGGGQCRSYRLAPAFRERPLVRHTIESHSIWHRLRKDAVERQRVIESQVAALPPDYRRLCEMERDCHLTGPAVEADEPIVPYLADVPDAHPRWFTVDDYGRVHHPVGVCPRTLRYGLRFRGSAESLHLADVSGSQILLTCLWVMGLTGEAEDASKERRGKGRKRGEEERKTTGRCLVCRRSGADWTDAIQMIEWLLTGEFGWRLEQEVNEERERAGLRPFTSAAVKVGRMSALFGDWRMLEDKWAGRALLRLFPAFMNRWAERVKELPHGELARRMQAVESGIMIGGVAGRVMRERPGVRFVTIHDAVMCEQPHVEYAVKVIRDTWEEFVGLAPLVKQQSVTHVQN